MLGDPRQMADFADSLKKQGREKYVRTVESIRLFLEIRQARSLEKLKAAVAAGIKFLEASPPQPLDGQLGTTIAQISMSFPDDPWAEANFRALAKVFAASKRPQFADFNALLAGTLRRLDLVGKPMTVEGKLLTGEKFDWSMYAGKIVLVNFWATACVPWLKELPNLQAYYDTYHDKGFEIVGISCDGKRADVETFVKDKKIPWAILFGDEKQPSPTFKYYSVMTIPTAILVGRNGKVLSLKVRGDKLGEELAKLLGPPKEKKEKENAAVKEPGAEGKEKPDKPKSSNP